jgi:hypothetical protein
MDFVYAPSAGFCTYPFALPEVVVVQRQFRELAIKNGRGWAGLVTSVTTTEPRTAVENPSYSGGPSEGRTEARIGGLTRETTPDISK